MKKPIIAILLLFFIGHVNAVEVSKDSWVEHMETALPTYQCQSQAYFRQCFDVTAEKCEEVMGSATRTCLDQVSDSIPDILNQPQDGTMWGSRVGSCAGRTYEITLAKQRTNTDRCNNINNWR